MSRTLPDRVKAGDTLSAAWLNSIIDYLKGLNDMQARRRLLKGVGYTVSESPGGSSLTIDRQAVVRVLSDDLDTMRNEEFQVRIRPKGLSQVNKETGDWDKVVQVHVGRVTNHRDFVLPVVAKDMSDGDTGGAGSSSPEAVTTWDAADWVDMGTLAALGKARAAGEENCIEVFVRLTFEGGLPMEAVFCTSDGTAEGDENTPTDTGNSVYIPIGKISGESVEGSPRYYITQYQQGPIELGGGGSGAMPFDVSVGTFMETPDTEDEEPTVKACLNVAGGRIFLPEREYATIPDKKEWPLESGGSSSRYVILTLMRGSDGELQYRYELADLSSLGTEIKATEENQEGAV